MRRIVISGYYGFNNIGDESILKAVVGNLRSGVEDIDIMVLSNDPAATEAQLGVKAVHRMKPFQIMKALLWCDLLVSGGGSLLQDVTSRRSVIYYLMIIRMAQLLGKKVIIYSQGIGPINSEKNRRRTIRVLKPLKYIIVRDEASAEFLRKNGIPADHVYVTADPVLKLKNPGLETGRQILAEAGLDVNGDTPVVGFAIKGTDDTELKQEMANAAMMMHEKYGVRIVLIPFHYTEDSPVTRQLSGCLGDMAVALDRKFSTEEMMSVIGNMDYIVGVRLHSLIHAATMGVPMIGVSYDPKINQFMKGLGLKALSSIYDFEAEFLVEEFERIMNNRESYIEKINAGREKLSKTLSLNEELINRLLDE